MYDIIVVGGGAAGLMATKTLSAAGRKVLLLEAKEIPGGRIQQIQGFWGPAEAGAEFIHGNLQTTFALLKDAGIKKEKVRGHYCSVIKGKWEVSDEIIPYWDHLMKEMNDCEEDISIADFLHENFQAKKYHRLRTQFARYVEGYHAADTKKISVFATRKEMEGQDAPHYRPIPNYWAVIDFLLKACLQCKATIKTNEPVVEINTTRNVEVVTTLAKYNCRKILIAVPLGILQRSKNSAGYINFPRSVINHIKAAKKIGSGGVIKFLFEFDEAFWLNKKFLDKKNIPAPSYIFTDTKIPTWWTQYPADYPLLTGWVAGPDSHKMKNYSPRKLKKIGLEALSSVFSMPPEALNDRLKTATIINWIKEPYIFGGYSYPTLQTEMARNIISEPVGNSFYFAGEYVIKDSSSTVDAALQSGQEAAKKILRAYSGKSL